ASGIVVVVNRGKCFHTHGAQVLAEVDVDVFLHITQVKADERLTWPKFSILLEHLLDPARRAWLIDMYNAWFALDVRNARQRSQDPLRNIDGSRQKSLVGIDHA